RAPAAPDRYARAQASGAQKASGMRDAARAAEAGVPRSSPRIAIALGGGSARGLAHIVVLEALDELGVTPVAIAGTSMGAVCGALYAAGVPGAEIRAAFVKDLASPTAFLRQYVGRAASGLPALWSPRRPGGVDIVTLFEMFLPGILHCDFAALKVPFMAVAADL